MLRKTLIEQEVLVGEEYKTLVILWCFVKFYDASRYDATQRGCEANDYGRRKTAMTMMVHAAPRFLKMGKAVGRMIPSMERGIVAGCRRTQSMPIAYTNKAGAG